MHMGGLRSELDLNHNTYIAIKLCGSANSELRKVISHEV